MKEISSKRALESNLEGVIFTTDSPHLLKCIVGTVETNLFVNIQTVVSCLMNAQMSLKNSF